MKIRIIQLRYLLAGIEIIQKIKNFFNEKKSKIFQRKNSIIFQWKKIKNFQWKKIKNFYWKKNINFSLKKKSKIFQMNNQNFSMKKIKNFYFSFVKISIRSSFCISSSIVYLIFLVSCFKRFNVPPVFFALPNKWWY